MTKKRLIISHANCTDGMGAAFAAYLRFGNQDTDYWFAAYGSEPPYKMIKDREVMMFDFSYPKDRLLEIKKQAKSFIVIDHHKSAEKDLEGLDFCKFDMSKSGAVLAWEYLHDKDYNYMFYHIQDYDLWKFECSNTKPFSFYLRSFPNDFQVWLDIYKKIEAGEESYQQLVREGKGIERYYNQQLASNVKSTKVPVTINGVKGLGANLPGMFSSEAGNILATESGTFGFTYFFHGSGDIKCSLRSVGDQCNTIELAKLYGGGGHVNASGCSMTRQQLQEVLGVKVA